VIKSFLTILILAGIIGCSLLSAENNLPDIVAIKIAEPPQIDGILNDTAWSQVARYHRGVLSGWHKLNRKKELATQQRVGYVAYDDDALYIGMQAFTPDVFALDIGNNPFVGDCLEIHLKTPTDEYFQFGIDADGNFAMPKDAADSSSIKRASDIGANYWSTELAIPWKFLKISPKDGVKFALNLAANKAYQGENESATITWGESFGVSSGRPVCELKEIDLARFSSSKKKAAKKKVKQKTTTAYPLKKALVIDGKLDDDIWKKLAKNKQAILTDWHVMGQDSKKIKRFAWLAYDDKRLYIAFIAKGIDPEMLETEAENPAQNDNIRIDFSGAATGIDCNSGNLRIILPYVLPIESKAFIGKDFWSAEIAVNWTDIQGKPAPGKPVEINLGGFDSGAGKTSWSQAQDYRDVKNFGTFTIKK
jgi:hypothetical protein